MDNIIVKITAESDMSDAVKDFESLKQNEAQILQGMEALKKKQAEFQGAPKVISLLDAEYKKLEKDLKTTQTSMSGFAASQKKVNDTVVDSAVKHTSLRTQIAALREELSRMEMAGKDSSKAYIDLSVRAGQLQDQMGDTRQTIQHLSSDTRGLDTAMGVGRGLAGGFSVATSAAALLGGENEQLTAAFLKVQAAMSILNGVQEVADVLNKNSAVMVNIRTAAENSSTIAKIKGFAATTTQNVATTVQTGLESKNIVVKGASTVAQWALNSAMLASPITWLIVGIMAVVGAFVYFSNSSKKAKTDQDTLNLSMQQTSDAMQKSAEKTELTAKVLEAQGRSARDIQLNGARERMKLAEDNFKLQEAALKKAGDDATDIQKENYTKSKQDYKDSIKELKTLKEDFLVEDIKISTDANKKKSEDQKAADQSTQDKAKEHASYMLDISKQLEDNTIAIMADGTDKQVALIELEYKRKLAAIKGNSAKEIALRESLEIQMQQKIAKLKGEDFDKEVKRQEDLILSKWKLNDLSDKELEKRLTTNIGIEEDINETGLMKYKKAIKKQAAAYKLTEEDKIAIAQQSAEAINEIGNLLFDGASEKRQIEMDDLDREYSAKIEAEEGNSALQKKLEDELAAKKLEIRIKQAKADKAQALFNLGISTAQALLAAWTIVPANPVISGIQTAFVSALAIAQTAAIASKPLPKYAKGKKAGGKGHFATVGELGAETMWIPDNAAIIPHNRQMNFDTFKDFGIPAEMDSKWIKGTEIDYDKLGASVGKHVRIPTPKPVTVHVDRSGVAVDYSGNKTTYLNKKYQGSWN